MQFLRMELLFVAPLLCATGSVMGQGENQPDVFNVMVVTAVTNRWILPDEVPADVVEGGTIELAACRREYESGSFIIHAQRALSDVRMTVTNLTGQAGTIPSSAVDLSIVKVWYQSGRGIYIEKEKRYLVPELLLKEDGLVRLDTERQVNLLKMPMNEMRDADELQAFDIPVGAVKQIWVTVQVPVDAATGEYGGTIQVTVGDEGDRQKQVPITVRVRPFDLDEPNKICSMYYRGQYSDGSPVCHSDKKTEQQMLADLRSMVAHGVRSPISSTGVAQLKNGSCDMSLLRRDLELRRQAGMSGGPLLLLGVSISSPQQVIEQAIRLAREYGFTDVHVAAADEAKGDALREQRKQMVRAHKAGAKVFVANFAHDSYQIVGDLLDLPNLAGGHDYPATRAAVQTYHAMGHKVMSYANPQGGMEMPETYRRNYGLHMWRAGIDGACTYAYQHSFGEAWDDFDRGYGPWREHNMTYPTVNGLISTLQWEGYREGYDDLRYVATLENLLNRYMRDDGHVGEVARTIQLWLRSLDVRSTTVADSREYLSSVKYIDINFDHSYPDGIKPQHRMDMTLDDVREMIAQYILKIREVIEAEDG